MNLSRVILRDIRIGTKTEFLQLLYPFSYFKTAAPIDEQLKSIWMHYFVIRFPSNDRFHFGLIQSIPSFIQLTTSIHRRIGLFFNRPISRAESTIHYLGAADYPLPFIYEL